jgi:hypothetical protein
MVIPMLDEKEWSEIEPLLGRHIETIRSIRAAGGLSLAEARKKAVNPACQRYKEITGFDETNGDAIWHHRRSLYGQDCPKCGKPLRTPRASYCVACGLEKTTGFDAHTHAAGRFRRA